MAKQKWPFKRCHFRWVRNDWIGTTLPVLKLAYRTTALMCTAFKYANKSMRYVGQSYRFNVPSQTTASVRLSGWFFSGVPTLGLVGGQRCRLGADCLTTFASYSFTAAALPAETRRSLPARLWEFGACKHVSACVCPCALKYLCARERCFFFLFSACAPNTKGWGESAKAGDKQRLTTKEEK